MPSSFVFGHQYVLFAALLGSRRGLAQSAHTWVLLCRNTRLLPVSKWMRYVGDTNARILTPTVYLTDIVLCARVVWCGVACR
jgi:hypothetical protein